MASYFSGSRRASLSGAPLGLGFTFLLILIATLGVVPQISGQGNSVVRYPFLVQGDLPVHPPLAKTARITGTVQIRVTVENGEVVGTVTISGHPLFVDAAIDDIQCSRLEQTVKTTFATTFIYRLDGESEKTKEPSNPTLELELSSWAKIAARPLLRKPFIYDSINTEKRR